MLYSIWIFKIIPITKRIIPKNPKVAQKIENVEKLVLFAINIPKANRNIDTNKPLIQILISLLIIIPPINFFVDKLLYEKNKKFEEKVLLTIQ